MVTPPIEENIVRVSISNELVESVLQDEELQGLLPIPNDDMDYADYVDAVTEGGDINGPFTAVQLDFTQLTPDDPLINLYTRYSYLSANKNDNRTSSTSILLVNTIFTIKQGTENVTVPANTALIRISPYDSKGYFRVAYIINQSTSSIQVSVTNLTRYAMIQIPTTTLAPYFHYCSTSDENDLGEIIVMDGANTDNNASVCYIKNTVYRIFIQVPE